MSTTFFKHFDLPVKHLDEGYDYVPPKARDLAEIERRRALPAGSVLAEAQLRGIETAARVIDYCAEHDDGEFSARVLAATAMNTAWYNLARDAERVMRRRLYLPIHGRTEPITRVTLLTRSSERMQFAREMAARHKISVEGKHCTALKHQRELGLRLGNTSLFLAAVEMAPEIEMARGETALAQRITRSAALEALEQSRNLYAEIGANPTLAQLADVDSPLSVYWRRNGSNEAVNALENAIS
ncbi:hypothetical protein KC878_03010 [Candidatus Saccharibacteria bacterium]|nr:hypothetical protein [Candidatus Saccharibacteria bacterium]MCB9821406.1 hypothetical protein [Candidatus Nomurabacteria bacterium]